MIFPSQFSNHRHKFHSIKGRKPGSMSKVRNMIKFQGRKKIRLGMEFFPLLLLRKHGYTEALLSCTQSVQPLEGRGSVEALDAATSQDDLAEMRRGLRAAHSPGNAEGVPDQWEPGRQALSFLYRRVVALYCVSLSCLMEIRIILWLLTDYICTTG